MATADVAQPHPGGRGRGLPGYERIHTIEQTDLFPTLAAKKGAARERRNAYHILRFPGLSKTHHKEDRAEAQHLREARFPKPSVRSNLCVVDGQRQLQTGIPHCILRRTGGSALSK
jgi:hypothetical protein